MSIPTDWIELAENAILIVIGGGASSGILSLVIKKAFSKFSIIIEEFSLIKKANQVQIRKDLISIYKECKNKGYADDEDREEFLDLWEVYHNLGENGVMDDKKARLFAMPCSPKYNRRLSDRQ